MAGVQKLAGASAMFLAASIAVGLVLGTDDPYVGEGARVRHNVAAWMIFFVVGGVELLTKFAVIDCNF